MAEETTTVTSPGLAELAKGQELLTKLFQQQQQQQDQLAKTQQELVSLMKKQEASPSASVYPDRRKNSFKCFYCQKPGHRQANCRQKARDQQKTGNEEVASDRMDAQQKCQLTEQLGRTIGSRPVVPVILSGKTIDCLIDTGSDVSTIPYKIYQENFKDTVPFFPTTDWIDLTASNGLKIPYEGVAVLDVEIQDIKVPERGFIVVQDLEHQAQKRAPGIIGTNILKHLPSLATILAKPSGSQCTSLVRVVGSYLIPRASVCDIRASVRRTSNIGLGLIEGLSSGSGFKGVEVTPGLVRDVGTGEEPLYVKVCNFTERDVTLKPNTKIGVLSAVQEIRTDYEITEVKTNKLKLSRRSTEQERYRPPVPISDFPGTEEERRRLEELLVRFSDVFHQEGEPLGMTPTITHRITMEDPSPITQPYRRVPPYLWEELKNHIQDLLQKGIITESTAEFASPIVIVRKKSGGIQMCVDFRKINQKVKRDSYPLPRIQESLESLNGAKYFSTLDLTAAYNQVGMEPKDQAKTAFTTPLGLFEYRRMPFGLSNSPATFSRLMGRVFREDIFRILLVYLDDVLVFSKTIDEHLQRLEVALSRLRHHQLKLEPKKCVLFRPEVNFLGHVITPEGIKTDPDKIRAVREWKRPETLKELRQFMGLAAYYRRFVHQFAKMAAPLYSIIRNMSKDKRMKRIGNMWTDKEESSFQALKDALTSCPILGYPDLSLPFIVETDASKEGLGAVLSQRQEGKMKVIAYASRGLRPAEKKIVSSMKLETLALKWAIVDKWRDYLLGSSFVVKTDNNPLTHLMKKSKLSAIEQQWVSALAGFHFTIEYRPGKTNSHADALSRQTSRPWDEDSVLEEESVSCEQLAAMTIIPLDLVADIMDSASLSQVQTCEMTATALPTITLEGMRDLQREDSVIARLIQLKEEYQEKPLPAQFRKETPEIQLLLRQWHRIKQKDGVFYRVLQTPQMGPCEQVILPSCLKKDVLQHLHDKQGHQGVDRTLTLIRNRCYWPRMDQEVRKYIEQCEPCLLAKGARVKTPLGSLVATRPLEVLAIDCIGKVK